MKFYPRKGYEEHLEFYHTLACGDGAARAAAFTRQQALMKNASLPESIRVETREIPGPEEGQTLTLRILRPAELPAHSPMILDIHGGAWVGGAAIIDDFRCALLAEAVPCIVVSVEYRLAPQHPFPAALLDCNAALQWMRAHADSLSGDADRIGLHGTSAGANIAAGLSLYLRDNDGPRIALAALVNGAFGLNKTHSHFQMQRYPLGPEGDYTLSPEARYLGNLDGQQPSYYAFPALCPMLLGFPAALVVVSEYDQLRDDGIAFAKRLYDANVPCELTVAPRVGHGFMAVDNPLTRQFVTRMADSFRNEFGML